MKKNESHLHVYYQGRASIKYRREAMVTWDSIVGKKSTCQKFKIPVRMDLFEFTKSKI